MLDTCLRGIKIAPLQHACLASSALVLKWCNFNAPLAKCVYNRARLPQNPKAKVNVFEILHAFFQKNVDCL